MSEIVHVRGDATVPSVKGVKVIAHVCNDIGGRGKGFVPAVSRRRPRPEAAYGQGRSPKRRRAASMCGSAAGRDQPHTTRRHPLPGGPTARQPRPNQRSDMPRIGCGPAGGKWSRLEPLINERLVKRGIRVAVYDHGEGQS